MLGDEPLFHVPPYQLVHPVEFVVYAVLGVVGGIVSPGYAPDALTVGATNTQNTVYRSDDTVATWSSRGPVGNPEDPSGWLLKPDVVAPGTNIISTADTNSVLWQQNPTRRVEGVAGGKYLRLSGTSMSTAVVSGAAALVLQALERTQWNQTKAATLLGLNRDQIRYRIEKFALERASAG